VAQRRARIKCACGGAGALIPYPCSERHDPGYFAPILSNALGVAPNQVAEMQKRFPHHRFAPDGRMIFRSHQERNRVLKDLGYHDKDGYN
jgi:hypothetical protein